MKKEAIVIQDKFAGYAGNKIVAVVAVPEGKSDCETFDMWINEESFFSTFPSDDHIDPERVKALRSTHSFAAYELIEYFEEGDKT